MKSDFVGIEEADLISSEAKPKISSELCEDFTVPSTISLYIQVAFLHNIKIPAVFSHEMRAKIGE